MSGSGWPASPARSNPPTVTEKKDFGHLMIRTEVRSAHGNRHLGHVLTDGPRSDGGMRYCIKSAALRFVHLDDLEEQGEHNLLFCKEEAR